jgi:hypothetical protein
MVGDGIKVERIWNNVHHIECVVRDGLEDVGLKLWRLEVFSMGSLGEEGAKLNYLLLVKLLSTN